MSYCYLFTYMFIKIFFKCKKIKPEETVVPFCEAAKKVNIVLAGCKAAIFIVLCPGFYLMAV